MQERDTDRAASATEPEASVDDASSELVREAPANGWVALRQIGPGLIIAASIVGSGELIATTKTGAEAGFSLLWLIVLGCAIKTFAQIELGRHTITWSRTTLDALNSVPGPRLRVNWIVWYWVVLTMLMISQQGGIVGGIGQSLASVFPLSRAGAEYDRWQEQRVNAQIELAKVNNTRIASAANSVDRARLEEELAEAEAWLDTHDEPWDSYRWAVIVAAPTSIVLFFGHYRTFQTVATFLVVVFTGVTAFTLVMLQTKPAWAISGEELQHGLGFHMPTPLEGKSVVATALAAFGLIGVGASELLQYPYWCLEKGYARYTGPRLNDATWYRRARGWLTVMQIDAWLSMVIFTFSTVAFYLLGAAVMWRCGINPEKSDMVRTLTAMYVPVFGAWAPTVFLFGAISVLYSTYFVASASNALMVADGLGLLGLASREEGPRRARARIVRALWPWLAVVMYLTIASPVTMVLLCGVGQTMMLPMLGGAALWFRYRRSDPELRSGWWFDVGLWLSMAGFVLITIWFIYDKFLAGS